MLPDSIRSVVAQLETAKPKWFGALPQIYVEGPIRDLAEFSPVMDQTARGPHAIKQTPGMSFAFNFSSSGGMMAKAQASITGLSGQPAPLEIRNMTEWSRSWDQTRTVLLNNQVDATARFQMLLRCAYELPRHLFPDDAGWWSVLHWLDGHRSGAFPTSALIMLNMERGPGWVETAIEQQARRAACGETAELLTAMTRAHATICSWAGVEPTTPAAIGAVPWDLWLRKLRLSDVALDQWMPSSPTREEVMIAWDSSLPLACGGPAYGPRALRTLISCAAQVERLKRNP